MSRMLVSAGMVISLAVMSAAPQVSPTGQVYRSQYTDLKSKAVALLERATSRGNARSLHEEQLALLKLVHRLEEQAMSDNGTRSARGQPSDRALLLVAQACNGLDFLLAAVDNYVETGDRAFLTLARQAVVLTDSVERLF